MIFNKDINQEILTKVENKNYQNNTQSSPEIQQLKKVENKAKIVAGYGYEMYNN